MRFGKFKALANYTKVGKHTHMKHLFVGAWNLSAGLSCLKNFNLNNAPKFPLSVSALCQAAFPKFHHLASPPVPLECSLKHKQTVLLSPPGLFATFISDKVTGKRLDLTQCSHSSVSKLQYTIAQKLFFSPLSSSGRNLMWGMLLMMLHKKKKTVWHSLSLGGDFINMERRIKYTFLGANRHNEKSTKMFLFQVSPLGMREKGNQTKINKKTWHVWHKKTTLGEVIFIQLVPIWFW